MWRAAGLEEPDGKWKGAGTEAATWEGGQEVDNLTAGGFFQQYGRERAGPCARVIPAHIPTPPQQADDAVSDGSLD